MFSILVLSCSVLAAAGADQATAKTDLDAYEAARAKVGRDADAHVKLALWCEAHGLSAERVKHLMLATLINPQSATARGLLGLVFNGRRWQKPEEARNELSNDPQAQARVSEYLTRRAATPDRPEAQWKLAQWCEHAGLKDQALAHYSAVVRLDPRRDAAWKKLGYRKHGEQWVKPEELAAARSEAELQKLATKHWKPILEKYREGLGSKAASRRTRAETGLAEIRDPRAVPAVWEVFVQGDENCQLLASQVFGQIDAPAAARALAALAVFAPSPMVRGRAIETAVRHDPRDFLTTVLSLIRTPFKYKVQPTGGPGSEGVLFVEGERFNLRRLYQVQAFDPRTLPPRLFTPDVPFNPFTVPNLMLASGWAGWMPASLAATAQQLGESVSDNPVLLATLIRQHATALRGAAAQGLPGLAMNTQLAGIQRDQQIALRLLDEAQFERAARQTLQQDVQSVEMTNAAIRQLNDRVLPLAVASTGQDFGNDGPAWMKWWTNELGYAYESPESTARPTYTQVLQFQYQPPVHTACFAVGTPVHTSKGPLAIETLQVGDDVLSQNTTTGALSFRPVVAIHHNKPAATLKLRLSGETIVATGIHRFWKAGQGWVMARDLKTGDAVRAVGRTVRVESVEPDAVQPVYNLDVAENRNFFVGRCGCLVYDFSIVQPVSAPFDQPVDLVSLRSAGK